MDILGRDIYHIIQPLGAFGAGHSAAIIGNSTTGYDYYSYGGYDAGTTNKQVCTRHFTDLASAKAWASANTGAAGYAAGYKAGEYWKTDSTQDAAARAAAMAYNNTDYNVVNHNCWNMVYSALSAAGTTAMNYGSDPNLNYEKNKSQADGNGPLE